MRTSEFIEKALEIGSVDSVEGKYGDCLLVKDWDKRTLASARIKGMYAMDTSYLDFSNLVFSERKELFSLLVEYAATPVGKREGPKKYKLKHKLIRDNGYLNYFERKKEFIFSTGRQIGVYKTTFTIQEWEALTEQTWEDLLLQFKAIEV